MRVPLTIAIVLAASVLAASAPAVAQSVPDWISVDGHFALGYSDRTPGADVFGVGDATLRFSPDFTAPFGFELGFYGRADALDTPHETYGALIWDLGQNGRLSLGAVRPAYDGFAVSALEISFPSLGIDRAGSTRSAATFGAMFANWLPYGASFSNHTDTLHYAVSVHHASNVDTTVASFGAGADYGDWQFSGALEAAWGTSTEVSGKLQAKGQFGPVTGGVGYYTPGIVGGSDLVELFATYRPQDNLEFSAVAQVPVDGAKDPTAGVAARYSFTDHTDVSVGVASDAGSDAVLNAFVDFRF